MPMQFVNRFSMFEAHEPEKGSRHSVNFIKILSCLG